MQEAGGWKWRAGLVVGLAAAAAGVAYGFYRKRASPGSGVSEGHPDDPGGRGEASEAPGLPSPDRAPLGGPPQGDAELSRPPHGILEPHQIQSLLRLLESSEDTLVQEQILVTLSNSAAFSVNQEIIRDLGGLPVIGKMISVPATDVKQKALNALNNLSMNAKNQEELKIYITKVCGEVDTSSVNSELQLAALRFLTNISVTNDYHSRMIRFVPTFLHLLFEGNERTQVQVLKILVNLSANPAMAEPLLRSQAPLLSLMDSCINKDILVRVLAFAANLTKSVKNAAALQNRYNEDSIFSAISSNSLYTQRLASLLHHYDAEVKEQVAKLILQQR